MVHHLNPQLIVHTSELLFIICNFFMCPRLQMESELFEQWLQATEERATKKKDLRLLQEEALQQR